MENLETNNATQSENKSSTSKSRKRNIALMVITILSGTAYIIANPFSSELATDKTIANNSENADYNLEDYVLTDYEMAEFQISDSDFSKNVNQSMQNNNSKNYDDNNLVEGISLESSNSKKALLEKIKAKNIFQIKSEKPEGFYIMVGSFSVYQNAMNLQNNNPTQLSCYIFEPTSNNELNRVGLFVSETNLMKSEKVLSKIKMMQPQSWILYNSNN